MEWRLVLNGKSPLGGWGKSAERWEQKPLLAQEVREFWIKSCHTPRKTLPEEWARAASCHLPQSLSPIHCPAYQHHPPVFPG